MSFRITHDLLAALGARCHFSIPGNEMVFFGIRGCLPLDPENHEFDAAHEMKTMEVNYTLPRCTLGQWVPAKRKIAVYPGSTCPNRSMVENAAAAGGVGANQLLTGYYSYARGLHQGSRPTRVHRAFRQEEDRVVLRNSDDSDFDFDDRVSLGNPNDNLHAGWCPSLDGNYSSAGCQVVVGYPTTLDGGRSETGPWKSFRKAAYDGTSQNVYRYILINGWEIEAIATNPDTPRPVLIRFGSTGPLVGRLQQALLDRGLISFSPDNECGPRTTEAIIKFQKQAFGAENTDGIIGPQSAAALDITDWPMTNTVTPSPAPAGAARAGSRRTGATHKPVRAGAAKPATAVAPGYNMPTFATAELGPKAGVPWDKAIPRPSMNLFDGKKREGLVRDSVHIFADGDVVKAVYYESKFAIDGDGAGGNHEGDPAFQAHTSLRNADGSFFDSRKRDFIVLPLPPKGNSDALQRIGVGLGDLGVVIFKNGDLLPVIYGDQGPRGRIGEGSMSAAEKLGINSDPNIGGIDAGEIPPGVVHLVFPGSAELTHEEFFPGTNIVAVAHTTLDADGAKTKALKLLDEFRSGK